MSDIKHFSQSHFKRVFKKHYYQIHNERHLGHRCICAWTGGHTGSWLDFSIYCNANVLLIEMKHTHKTFAV